MQPMLIMNKGNLSRAALAIACAATMLLLPGKASGDEKTEKGLVGVWKVTRHGMNCQTGQQLSSFPALMTFHEDGTLHGDSVGPGSTAAEGTAEHGVWNRRGPDYSFRFLGH